MFRNVVLSAYANMVGSNTRACIVATAVLGLVACGGTKEADKGSKAGKPVAAKPAEKPADVPKKPEAKPESVGVKPAPKPEPKPPSAVQTATSALKDAKPKAALAALKTLRTHIDNHPKSDDLAAAAKLLANTALAQAATAAQAGDLDTARALAAALLDTSGKLASTVANGLVMDRSAIESSLVLVAKGDLDDLDALAEMAKGTSPGAPAAKAIAAALLGSVVAAFPAEGTAADRFKAAAGSRPKGTWSLCSEARVEGAGRPQDVCPPVFYGLDSKEGLAALTDEALPVMRLKALASKAGDKAPTGVIELPTPKHAVAKVTRTSAETETWTPIETVLVTEAGVHLVTRPLVQLEATTLASGEAWPGPVVMTTAQLEAVEKPEDLAPLVEALGKLRERAATAESTVFGADDKRVNSSREKGLWAVTVATDPKTTHKQLAPVLTALESAGFHDVRYRRAQGEAKAASFAVPVSRAMLNDVRQGNKETRPLIVEVTAAGATVYPPKGERQGTVETVEIALPASAKRWYKGTKVFKISVSGEDTAALVQTVRSIRKQAASGNVITVTAAADVPAQRTLAVAAALADAKGPAVQTKLSEVFPGVVCKDEDPTLASSECRSLFPIVP
ncbi:MAG: hypothetical protein ACI9OJ_003052, partial [Myxococcota bacterium]